MKRGTIIGIGIGIIILVSAAATVMRRAWWHKRIAARWQMNRWAFDDVVNRYVLQVESIKPDTSLAELVTIWRNGREGWTRVGQAAPTPPTETPTGTPDHANSPVGMGDFDDE